jgi:GAF domain-containing protein
VGLRLPLSNFPFAQFWQESRGRLVLIGDTRADTRLDEPARAFFVQMGALAAVVLPLALGGRWVGQVLISWPAPRAFSEPEMRLYESLAAQAAVAVNNRVLFEQTRKRANREALINAISQKIQGTVTVQSALETAVQELGQALQARRASVALEPAGPASNGNRAARGGSNGNSRFSPVEG